MSQGLPPGALGDSPASSGSWRSSVFLGLHLPVAICHVCVWVCVSVCLSVTPWPLLLRTAVIGEGPTLVWYDPILALN